VAIGQAVAEIWRFFDFWRWRPPPCWIFKIWKFWGCEGSRGSKCVTTPNFAAIGQTVAEIWRFFDFSRWRPPPTLISKYGNLRNGNSHKDESVSMCQISWRSVKSLLRYSDFSISPIWRLKWLPNDHCKLRGEWTKVNQIFTRCREDIRVSKRPSASPSCYRLWNASPRRKAFGRFRQFWRLKSVPWQRPLTDRETNTRSNILSHTSTKYQPWKFSEDRSGRCWDLFAPIKKKMKDKKKVTAVEHKPASLQPGGLTGIWADAQSDGRPAQYNWRPLLNAAAWLTTSAWVPCSNADNIYYVSKKTSHLWLAIIISSIATIFGIN